MKSKPTQEKASSRPTRSRSVAPNRSGQLNDTPNLQPLIGNRAVRRLLGGTSNLQSSQAPSSKETQVGLPTRLRAGIENLSGLAMDHVKVHYSSSKPAKFHALAHTHGNEIYLGPGQEKHLAHEAWHVVQQKQGRVKANGAQTKRASINDDAGLEAEADRMGAEALRPRVFGRVKKNNFSTGSAAVGEAMQLKKRSTGFGEFETTKFDDGADGRGVDIILKFHPDEKKVDAKKIALSQSVKATKPSGEAYAIDPNKSIRMVGRRKSGAGYITDRLSDVNNPIYGSRKLGAAEELKDTPESANTTAAATEVGTNTKYELGHCFKESPADVTKKKHSAGLYDTPRSGGKGERKMFETAAFAIEGTDKDKYYGSVKWGYKVEGTAAAPTVKSEDITVASKGGVPSANFIAPAKLWNKAKTRGTLQVTADPEATVLKGDASGTEALAKDTKLKQLDRIIMWESEPSVNAEVLNADGTGSGKNVYIKNIHVKDMGDGSETKKLPIPIRKPTVKKK